MVLIMIFVLIYLALLEGIDVFSRSKVTVLTSVGLQSYSEEQCIRKIIGEV
jgi:hypothetical protein